MRRQDTKHKEANLAHGFSVENLRGIALPFITPFDARAEVDMRAIGLNIEIWNKLGVTGYVALGSTGERVHLEERKPLEIIRTARAVVPHSLTFIVGVGQQSTLATIDEVRVTAEAGADAVLVITPHFYRAEMTQGAFVNHYRAVADASSVPVLLYNASPFTAVTIQPETIARLAEHENIVGVKDSSGDVVALAEAIRLVPEDFAVLTGSGSALYPALCVGAKGAILAVGCIAPRLAVEIYDAFQAGEHERARELQKDLTRLTRGIIGRFGIGGLKAALDMLGYVGGSVRAPLQDASAEARREIAKVLRETGLLGDEIEGEDEHRRAGASIK